MWVKGRIWTGYHGVNTFQWYWLLQSWNHLLQCLGTLPQSSQAGTCRPPRLSKGRAAALQRKSGAPFACWMLTYMQGWCSLACCGKVCESACCTSDWNKEDLEHRGRKSRRLRAKKEQGGQRSEGNTHLWDVSETCPSSLDLEEQSLRGVRNRITRTKHLLSVMLSKQGGSFWERHHPHYSALDKMGEHWLAAHTTMWTLRSGHDFCQAALTTHKAPTLQSVLPGYDKSHRP